MDNDKIVRLRLIFDVDVSRDRFDEHMYVNLHAFDEIRQGWIQICPDIDGYPGDLRMPGEGFLGFKIESRE